MVIFDNETAAAHPDASYGAFNRIKYRISKASSLEGRSVIRYSLALFDVKGPTIRRVLVSEKL